MKIEEKFRGPFYPPICSFVTTNIKYCDMEICDKCLGTGKKFELGKECNPCFKCGGTGKIVKN